MREFVQLLGYLVDGYFLISFFLLLINTKRDPKKISIVKYLRQERRRRNSHQLKDGAYVQKKKRKKDRILCVSLVESVKYPGKFNAEHHLFIESLRWHNRHKDCIKLNLNKNTQINSYSRLLRT